jgi:hypothetical protein
MTWVRFVDTSEVLVSFTEELFSVYHNRSLILTTDLRHRFSWQQDRGCYIEPVPFYFGAEIPPLCLAIL